VPLLKAAFDAHSGEGIVAVLTDFVDRVAEERQGGGAPPSGGFPETGDGSSGDGDGGGSGVLPVALLGLLGLGGGALFVNARRTWRR
jgi:hypothetical protein